MGLLDFLKKDDEKPAPKQPIKQSATDQGKPAASAQQPANQPLRSDKSADNRSVHEEPTVQQKTPETIYTVEEGDSLSKIAQKQYGDSTKWKQIFEANIDQIKDPDLVKPGQKLRIPKG